MATTTFVNGVTLTDAEWFNDVDAAVYQGSLPAGITALTVASATTLAVYNTIATTVNAFGAATTLNMGATTGTLTISNTTLAAKAGTFSTTLGVTGTSTLAAVNMSGDLNIGGGKMTVTASTGAIHAAATITADAISTAAEAFKVVGRAPDNVGNINFYANDGTTLYGSIGGSSTGISISTGLAVTGVATTAVGVRSSQWMALGGAADGNTSGNTLYIDKSNGPAGNPTTGGFIYVDTADSKLKYRGSSGTITTLALP